MLHTGACIILHVELLYLRYGSLPRLVIVTRYRLFSLHCHTLFVLLIFEWGLASATPAALGTFIVHGRPWQYSLALLDIFNLELKLARRLS